MYKSQAKQKQKQKQNPKPHQAVRRNMELRMQHKHLLSSSLASKVPKKM